MNHAVTLLVLAGSIVLCGCGRVDPWGEFHKLPAARAQPFDAEIEKDDPKPDNASAVASKLAGRTLSLGECIAIALEHNPRTAESWQAIRAAASRTGQAKADYLPAIGFTSSAARGETVQLDRDTNAGTQNRYEGLFGLRWLLFDGGGRESRVDAATAEVLAAGFRHNTTLQDVAVETVESYYGLLAARSRLQLAEETVRQRDYQLRLAQARHRAGVVSKSDVLRAQTEKAEAELSLVRARNAIEVVTGRLATVMGVSVLAGFGIAELPDIEYEQQQADLRSLLEEAAQNRPELNAALAAIRSREAALRLARSRYRPAVAVNSRLGWLGRSFLPDRRQWSLGVAVDLPLYTGFERTYQLHGSKAELDRARAGHRLALQGVEFEVWTAYWQTVEAGQAIEAAERFVASAEQSARVAEGEYKSGAGSMIGLIDAQTSLTAAKDRLIQARLDWRTALARLERAVGRSLAERIDPLVKEQNE